MTTSAQTPAMTGHKYAIVIGRTFFNWNTLELDTLPGVAATVRNMAVDLVRNGFKTVVLADTPMALSQRSFDSPTLEQHYVDFAVDATQTEKLLWVQADTTRARIRTALVDLAAMVSGHLPGPLDDLVVYICSHGVLNASDGSYGAALADVRCTKPSVEDANGDVVDAAQYADAYTMEQLRDDLRVEQEQRWRNTLVVLDTCHSGGAFDATEVSLRALGTEATDQMQTVFQKESYQCLAAVPCTSSAFCMGHGTVLHMALRRAWLSPGGDGGAFAREREGAARWATIGRVADRVNVELTSLMTEIVQKMPAHLKEPDDAYFFRQTCLLGRLPWRVAHNTGEFVVFNEKYTERNKLAMVPAVPASFTGRAKELRQLEARLKQSETAAIGNLAVSAAGGVGKSTLAAEYARRNAHKYHWIIWVLATSATTMMGSYREAVRYIPLKHVDLANATNEEVVGAVKEWLAHERGWLMVMDGCDAITEEMSQMVPGGVMEGKVVVTTRLRRVDELGALFGGGDAPLRLGVFDEKEGMEYMRKRLAGRADEDEEVQNIVARLGGMPLALELAAAYLVETPHVSAGEYGARMEVDRLATLKRRNGAGGLEDRVVATYEPGVARAMEIGGREMVRKMVGVMGFLEGSGMEVEVLRLVVVGERKKEKVEEDEFDVALGALCRLCVVDVNKSVVSMHQLVQDVCRVVAFGDEEEMWRELQRMGSVLEEEIGKDAHIYEDMEWSRRVGVHGMRVMEWACAEVGRRRRGGETEEYGDGVVWLGIRLSVVWRLLGLHTLARSAAESACDCVCDKRCVLAGSAFGTLGLVCSDQGEYTRALEVYGWALAIQEEKLGTDHAETGQTLNNMAGVFRARGDYSRALEHYERALTIREKSVGPDHPSTGDTLNNMACVFEAQGDYSRALEYYERALTIYEKSVGPDHPSTGQTLNNMAGVFRAQGDRSRALDYFQRALTIREKFLGPNHLHTKQTRKSLSALCRLPQRAAHPIATQPPNESPNCIIL